METKTRKAEVAHKIIETGESLLNVVWSKADARRKDLEEIFQDLGIDMNIFSYIVPAFTPGPNVKALLAWNDIGS